MQRQQQQQQRATVRGSHEWQQLHNEQPLLRCLSNFFFSWKLNLFALAANCGATGNMLLTTLSACWLATINEDDVAKAICCCFCGCLPASCHTGGRGRGREAAETESDVLSTSLSFLIALLLLLFLVILLLLLSCQVLRSLIKNWAAAAKTTTTQTNVFSWQLQSAPPRRV